MKYKYKKRYRDLVGEEKYKKIINDLHSKIIEISALKPEAITVIEDALWDNNPGIVYDDDFRTGQIIFTSLPWFFTKLEEYLQRAISNFSLK